MVRQVIIKVGKYMCDVHKEMLDPYNEELWFCLSAFWSLHSLIILSCDETFLGVVSF